MYIITNVIIFRHYLYYIIGHVLRVGSRKSNTKFVIYFSNQFLKEMGIDLCARIVVRPDILEIRAVS